jgi:23S rRNA (cytosine1962-C5)-methyltransferase
LFREALGGRPLRDGPGEVLEIVDESGDFVARGLYDPDAVVAVRVVSRDPGEILDGEAVLRRVRAARRLREAMLPPQTNAHRAFHGDGDGLPGVTVDRYGEHLVIHVFSPALEPLLPALYQALATVWSPKSIYEQRRYKPQTGEGVRAAATLVHGETAPVEIEVEERGVKFVVDVTAPLGTGLFPDLREARRAIGERSSGKRVLNLFSYTGAFSVWAARGGAREVVSVDLAQKAHTRARRNLVANGLTEQGHEFIAGDTFSVLARFAERRRVFDVIVVDPPSFGQAKGRVFSAQQDYRELAEGALSVAAPDSLLLCVSNTLKLGVEELDFSVGAAAGRMRRNVRLIERTGLPCDFPIVAGYHDGQYLKVLLYAVI